ncbi:methionine synthase reductase [Toxorhynchites rutilus septentrionalis]|uniref:methionine synthase reductase n=1 Tax=Toxorhynchites rutilus septentrionalis TaxID=329112 RepID=UPI0024786845|nr:methionine synthase reductase [Toxorhynchites rutilus septentrionalis]
MINIHETVAKYASINTCLPPAPLSYIRIQNRDEKIVFNPDQHLQSTCDQPFGATSVFECLVTNYKIIAQGEDIKTVYDFTLTTETVINHKFYPGDTVGILTENRGKDVDYIIQHLDLETVCHQVYKVDIDPSSKKKAPKIPSHVPQLVELRKLFSECLDINAIPKKLFLRTLVDYTSDAEENRFLSLLCNKNSTAFDYVILKQRIGFLLLLKSLPSCKPPVHVLLEHLPRLMPRPYSIVNCYDENGSNMSIRIIFSYEDQSPGLTTSLLKNCGENGGKLFLYFRKSNSFAYTDDDCDKDIVLIGVGTGIAPYLAFLERRRELIEQCRNLAGKAWLFAGFRYEKHNYLCREELDQYLKNGALNNVSVAFSRDENSSYPYVQNQIEANKEEFVEMLMSANSKLFACGNGTVMLPQIRSKIVQILSEVLCIDDEESNELVDEMRKNSKYVEDVWL